MSSGPAGPLDLDWSRLPQELRPGLGKKAKSKKRPAKGGGQAQPRGGEKEEGWSGQKVWELGKEWKERGCK